MAKGDISRALWKFVFYPQDLPEGIDWRDFLDDVGVPILVSPLHDMDATDEGEFKKAHRHALMQFDGPKPYTQALELVRGLGVKILKASNSRKRDERYMCHLDSPAKYLYDVGELELFGGYTCKFLSDAYEQDGISAIHDLAEGLGIIYYADLANEIITKHGELMNCLLRYPAHFNNYCYSRERLASKGDNLTYDKSRNRRIGRCSGR